jgi:diamine N-acetyltransferase
MILRPTRVEDLDRVLAMEADAEAARFVIRWSRSEHHRALSDPDHAHLVSMEKGRLVGFVPLAGLRNPNASIELQRIVVSPTDQSLGEHAIALVITHAFDTLSRPIGD